MRMLLLPLLGAVTACGPRPGMATARWVGSEIDITVSGEARGGWCPEARAVLLDVLADDRVAGVAWHYDSLVPGTYPVVPPTPSDSAAAGGAVAARYVYLDEVRGYQGLSGTLKVTAVDSAAISVTVEATLQRVGQTDTVRFTALYHRIPLTRDATLCTP